MIARIAVLALVAALLAGQGSAQVATSEPMRYSYADLNCDCVVDVLDEQTIASLYRVHFGLLRYHEWYDLVPYVKTGHYNGRITVHDLQYVFGREGSTCANPYPPGDPTRPCW